MSDKKMMLPHVHCKHERYLRGEVTIFGDKEPDLSYVYVDRIRLRDTEKNIESIRFANDNAKVDTADWYEKRLCYLYMVT